MENDRVAVTDLLGREYQIDRSVLEQYRVPDAKIRQAKEHDASLTERANALVNISISSVEKTDESLRNVE